MKLAELDCATPCGPVRLRGTRESLHRVLLEPPSEERPGRDGAASGLLAGWAALLHAYFRGRPIHVEAQALSLRGASVFQRRVYSALLNVPLGSAVSYGELASLCGRPSGARAVGQALGRNPLPLFIPCHRVVRADGRLGGFTAGEGWKQCLLRHEGWRVKNGHITGRAEACAAATGR